MFTRYFFKFTPRPSSTFWSTSRLICLLLIQLVLLFYTAQSFALTTETLPENIYSPALRYGQIQGLEQRYTESGALVKLTDYKSIQFDSETLAKFNSKANELISTLNKFGVYRAGDLFNLGTLEIDTKPEIKYFAPVLARGISETWTVALGLPVIQYSNTVSLNQKFSNIDYYNQFRGLSPDLDQALDTDLSSETQKALINKGYRPLESQKKQFLGDIQIVSVKKFLQNVSSVTVHILTISLPTGPAYDADDLLALNTFHEFSVENKLAFVQNIFYYLDIIPTLSAKYVLPEQITARVPKNSGDVLPDQSSKELITKNTGLTVEIGLNLQSSVTDQFKLGAGYNMGQKQKNSFSTSGKGDTSVLAEKTNTKWQKVNADISYTTVNSYLKSKKFIPMIVSFSVYDTIAGENVERRLGQEFNMTLFF